MIRRIARGTAPILAFALAVQPAMAQRGGADWMTAANDAQRSNWVRTDGKINVANMQKKQDGFQLYWKLKPTNTQKQLNSLMPPSMIEFYIGYKGFRSLGFFGASNDRVVGVDIDLGKLEWEKSIGPSANAPAGTPECPGGLTANVTRPTNTAYPAQIRGGFGGGRGGPAKSGVGEPHEGAVTLKVQPQPRPGGGGPPKPVAGAKPAPGMDMFAPRVQYAVALSSDGKLHAMWISNGHEANPAVPFIPANANAAGLISYDGTTYVSTLGGCPAAESGVFAMDMSNKNVTKWKASGKGIVGTAGQAAGPDGTVYVATNTEVAQLKAKSLEQSGSYKADGAEFTSSPVVFEQKEKDYVAVTSADGRLHVIDAATMQGVAKSDAVLGADYATGALASWVDGSNNRFILVPTATSVVAFKLTADLKLDKAWTSRELVSAAPPVIVNGVVFALSTGESRKGSVADRIKNSKPAVLYALNGADGSELWNSGSTITSFVHSGVMSSGGSRIFLATYEGTEYVFSFPMEH